MKSKQTNYADVYDPQTGVVSIKGMWSDIKFRTLIDDIGLSQINKTVICDGGTLHLRNMELHNIEIERYGFLSVRSCMLFSVNTKGILRARNSTVKDLTNDGQAVLSQGCKLQNGENMRHIELSRSYAYRLTNSDTSSIKATGSWLVECSAYQNASLYLGASRLIACTGTMTNWSSPAYDSPAIKPYINEYRLLFAAVDLLSQIDYIDSKTVITDKRQQRMIKYIDSMLKKKYRLPFDVAKDLVSTVALLSTPAQDNLRYTCGYRAIVFGAGGVGPKIIKRSLKPSVKK